MRGVSKNKQNFQQGALILLCSTVIVKLIGALFKIPLAGDMCLGDLGFGYFSSAYDLFTPVYSLAIAGFPIAVARVVSVQAAQNRFKDVRNSLKVTKKLYILTGLAAFTLMLALIYPFVRLTDSTGKTVYSLLAISPSIIFCCIVSIYRGYYEGLRNMYPTAFSNIIEALGKLILGFGFAFFTVKITKNAAYGAAAAMLGITVGTALSALYLYLRHKSEGDSISDSQLSASPPPESSGLVARRIIIIAIPVVLSSLAGNIATLVDVATVKWQLSRLMENSSEIIMNMYSESFNSYNANAASDLTASQIPTFLYGIRAKAFTIYNLVPTFTTVLGVSGLPVLASSFATEDNGMIKRNIESMLKAMSVIAFPVGCGLVSLSTPIMALLYNSKASLQIGGPLLQIYGVAAIFSGIAIPMTCMLQAINRQVAALRNVVIGMIIKIVVNYLIVAIPQVNIIGAAVGTLVCYVYIFIANSVTLFRTTKIYPDVSCVLLKPFISACLCGIIARLILMIGQTRIITVLSIFIAGIVYFISLISFRVFNRDEILSLPYGEKIYNIYHKCKIISQIVNKLLKIDWFLKF